MKLVVGLGNPGKRYENTRHNVGFIVVDRMAGELGIKNYKSSKKGKALYAQGKIGSEDFELFKPQTFMNDSGLSVLDAKKKHPNLENFDICVVHDDLDLPLGKYKIQLSKGPHRHNGVASVEAHLGSKEFWRLRVGIDNRGAGLEATGEDYVLERFSPLELESLNNLIEYQLIPTINNWLQTSPR